MSLQRLHTDGKDLHLPQQKIPSRKSQCDCEQEGQGGEEGGQGGSQGGCQGGSQGRKEAWEIIALVFAIRQEWQSREHFGDLESHHDEGRWVLTDKPQQWFRKRTFVQIDGFPAPRRRVWNRSQYGSFTTVAFSELSLFTYQETIAVRGCSGRVFLAAGPTTGLQPTIRDLHKFKRRILIASADTPLSSAFPAPATAPAPCTFFGVQPQIQRQ